MMIWGNEIVLNKVGSIAFADTLELRMCLFVKEHFHRLVKSRTHCETMTARGQVAARKRSAHEHFHRLVKRLRSMSDDISWMLLSLSFTRMRPEYVQQSCIFRCFFSSRVLNAIVARLAVRSSLMNMRVCCSLPSLYPFSEPLTRETESRIRSETNRTMTARGRF